MPGRFCAAEILFRGDFVPERFCSVDMLGVSHSGRFCPGEILFRGDNGW